MSDENTASERSARAESKAEKRPTSRVIVAVLVVVFALAFLGPNLLVMAAGRGKSMSTWLPRCSLAPYGFRCSWTPTDRCNPKLTATSWSFAVVKRPIMHCDGQRFIDTVNF